MNKYRRAMEDCPLPEGLEERMRGKALAAEPKARQKTVRPWTYAKKAALAAVVAGMLTVSAGAVVLVNWDAIFTDKFGPDAASTDMAVNAYQKVNVTSTCDDVTLTVREALGDDKTIYFILDYRLPETADLAAVEAAWGSYEDYISPPSLHYFATDGMTWEQLKERDEARWPGLDWTDWTSYGAYMHTTNALDGWEMGVGSGGTEGRAFDPETGTMTYLVRFTVGNAKNFTDQPLTVLASPPILVVGEERTALADQPALITFRPSYTARSISGEAEADGVAASAIVSPLAIQVAYRGPDYADTGDLLRDTWVVYTDGTEAAVQDLTQGYGGSKSDSGTANRRLDFSTTFLDLLDLDRVTAIRVGELEIPLSKTK